MIGSRMAGDGLSVGDQITLISPRGTTTLRHHAAPQGLTRWPASFRSACTSTTTASSTCRLKRPSSTSDYPEAGQRRRGLSSRIPTRSTTPAVTDAVQNGWRTLHCGSSTGGRANELFEAIQVERNVMFLILSLIILVAAFNISPARYMLVKGQGAGTSPSCAPWAPAAACLRIFFLSGALIGVVGTLAGFGARAAGLLRQHRARSAGPAVA